MTLLLGNFSENITLKLHFVARHGLFLPNYGTPYFRCHGLKVANFVTGNVTPYFFGKNVSRVTFRVTGVFSEKCHGLVKKCHGEKKNNARIMVQIIRSITLNFLNL